MTERNIEVIQFDLITKLLRPAEKKSVSPFPNLVSVVFEHNHLCSIAGSMRIAL